MRSPIAFFCTSSDLETSQVSLNPLTELKVHTSMEKNNLAPIQNGVNPVKDTMEEYRDKISLRSDAINAESEKRLATRRGRLLRSFRNALGFDPWRSTMPQNSKFKIQKKKFRRKYPIADDPKSNAHASNGRHVGNKAKRERQD